MKNKKLFSIVAGAIMASLVCIGAFIRVPLPLIPFTLQTLFVMLSGLLLGSRTGGSAVFIYMAAGLAGLPVFTGGGGVGYILKPSFGYIIGFVAGAYVAGLIAERGTLTFKRAVAACAASLGVIYALGIGYYVLLTLLYFNGTIELWPLFLNFVLLTLPGDVLKLFAAATISVRLRPVLSFVTKEKQKTDMTTTEP